MIAYDYFMLSSKIDVTLKDSFSEKATRAALKSGVQSALNSETVVIIDSLNYIKGFRYELACIAKSQRTQHCVLWVESDNDTAMKLNKDRTEEEQYDQDL